MTLVRKTLLSGFAIWVPCLRRQKRASTSLRCSPIPCKSSTNFGFMSPYIFYGSKSMECVYDAPGTHGPRIMVLKTPFDGPEVFRFTHLHPFAVLSGWSAISSGGFQLIPGSIRRGKIRCACVPTAPMAALRLSPAHYLCSTGRWSDPLLQEEDL